MKEEEKKWRWEEKSKSAWREGGEQEEKSVHPAPHISKEDDGGIWWGGCLGGGTGRLALLVEEGRWNAVAQGKQAGE